MWQRIFVTIKRVETGIVNKRRMIGREGGRAGGKGGGREKK